jgi:hypothetical protein
MPRRLHLAVRRGRFRCFAAAIALAVAMLAWSQPARTQAVDENALKVAFVFNFITFTEWPEATSVANEFQLCFLEGGLGGALATLEGRMAKSRPIRLKRVGMIEDARRCELLYIDSLGGSVPPSLLTGLRGASVLTVSDAENFARGGGMIGLVKRNNRIAFEINTAAATQAGLRFSAKLLNLATVVGQ